MVLALKPSIRGDTKNGMRTIMRVRGRRSWGERCRAVRASLAFTCSFRPRRQRPPSDAVVGLVRQLPNIEIGFEPLTHVTAVLVPSFVVRAVSPSATVRTKRHREKDMSAKAQRDRQTVAVLHIVLV